MAPQFSIVTVCRNAEKWIEKTIHSVRSQDFEEYEFIVVDGASTDGTGKIIEAHQSAIDQYVSEKDDGIADAMNKGARMARGELVIYLNAGDTFAGPGVLCAIAKSYREHRWEWATGATYYRNADDELITIRKIGRFDRSALRRHNYLCHQSTVVRQEVLEAVGGFRKEFALAMDYDMWLRLAERGDAHVLPFFVSNYLIGGVSRDTKRGYAECRRARNAVLKRGRVQWLREEAAAELWYRLTDWSLVYKVKRFAPTGVKRGLRNIVRRILVPRVLSREEADTH